MLTAGIPDHAISTAGTAMARLLACCREDLRGGFAVESKRGA
jgi:hypothetical protein